MLNIVVHQQNLEQALLEAETIATRAKNDPKAYVAPDIGNWAKKWVFTRFLGCSKATGNQGYFDAFDEQALVDLEATGPVGTIPGVSSADFEAQFTGEAKASAAVLTNIERMRGSYHKARTDAWFGVWTQAEISKNTAGMRNVYLTFIRPTLFDFSRLYNTMLFKMEQGPKPPLVAGPGEEIVHTPFGDIIRKKLDKPIGQYTGQELLDLLAPLFQK